MRNLITAVLLFCHSVTAQEVELYQMIPSWKSGETKIVTTNSKITTYIADTVFLEVSQNNTYKITVTELKNSYEFNYSQLSEGLGVDYITSNDLNPEILSEFVRLIEKKVSQYDYVILMDKETVQATGIKNERAFFEFVKKSVKEILIELTGHKSKDKAEEKQFEQNINNYFTTFAPQMKQTILNSVNYLFQAYSYGFPLNDVVSYETMVHDINAMGYFGTTEFPAIYTIDAREEGEDMRLKINTSYDKEFLLKEFKNKSVGMRNLTINDLLIQENEEIVFDGETSWIKEHKSYVLFEVPGVKVVENSVITFE